MFSGGSSEFAGNDDASGPPAKCDGPDPAAWSLNRLRGLMFDVHAELLTVLPGRRPTGRAAVDEGSPRPVRAGTGF